ncbi:MAG: hypothetical protein ACOYNS_06750 [Bacteroidota bacterium]
MLIFLVPPTLNAQFPKDYTGRPFHDDSVRIFPAHLPGILQCEYYDLGGEGVAYGGTKARVNGLNVGSDFNRSMGCNEGGAQYLCRFRDTEAVAVSYTKPCCDIDSVKNMFPQSLGQIYTGWTPPGQWMKYTVFVDTPGVYTIHFVYTAPMPEGLEFSLALNNRMIVDKARVPNSCHSDQKDGLRWHRWNKALNIAEITFPTKGLQLLTFTATYPDANEKNDLGNFDYIEFVRKGSVPGSHQ